MREHLAHFDIAGFTYYEGVLAFNELKIGEQLQLKLEEDNKYDPRAVAIYYNDFKLGFVPRSENRIIYKLLKVGIDYLEIRVQRISKKEHPENQVGVIIHLIKEEKETQE
ncbi:HIRAN domain-containing protein [Flavobacterium psychrotolerans]|uniref:DNA-binding protein n=1 Tax=Flavobacterium psychrotolerans TaxID=2169410 RepID=A0A2U1JNX6_9FLAO|nr:HIRAN domain-containing protein [Flavobacterium psychrotolerans]PWA06832.1 DNA-binding protein [Flavobacterium psychrotolerans]